MSARRKIYSRYVTPSGLVVINHRQTRHDWYVCRLDTRGRHVRDTVIAAHYLTGDATRQPR